MSNGVWLRKLSGLPDLSSRLMANFNMYSKFKLKSVVENYEGVFQELKSRGLNYLWTGYA